MTGSVRRAGLVALVALAVVAGTVPMAGGQSDSGYSVSVSEVSVSPSEPVPGEQVTLTATVENLESSSATVTVDSVYVRQDRGGEFAELARARDLGGVTPGSAVEVPLSLRFDDAGTRVLRVTANVVADGERTRVQYPVVVEVGDRHPQLGIETNESVVGQSQEGTVRVANGLSTTARNVELTLSGAEFSVPDRRRVVSSVEAGESVSVPFEYEPTSQGTHDLTATLRYRVAGSSERVVSETVPVEVDRRRQNVLVRTAGSGGDAVSIQVTNRGNVQLRNVTVGGEVQSGRLSPGYVGSVGPGETASARVNASLDAPSANATVFARYEVDGETVTATTTERLTVGFADIDLTGVSVTPRGGTVRIEGSTANVGSTPAESVVVSVADTAGVDPVAPSREYFVGSVPESDFVSFEVTAATTGSVSEVPLTVRYRADGEPRRETVRVPLPSAGANADAGEPAPARTEPSSDSGSGSLAVVVFAGLAVVGAGAAMVFAWRRSRGDS